MLYNIISGSVGGVSSPRVVKMDYLVVFSAFIAGIVATIAFFWFSKRYALTLIRQQANASGRAKQEAQADRMTEAIGKVFASYQQAKSENKDLKSWAMEALPSIAVEYPDVTARLAKKGLGQQFAKELGL